MFLDKLFHSYVNAPPNIQIAEPHCPAEKIKAKCEEIFPSARLFALRMRDNIYNLPSYQGVWTLVRSYRKKHSYVLEFYDCDDIAADFWGYCHHPNVSGIPAAYCESLPHAFNFIVGYIKKGDLPAVPEGLTVFIVEPGGDTPSVWPLVKPLDSYTKTNYRVTEYII